MSNQTTTTTTVTAPRSRRRSINPAPPAQEQSLPDVATTRALARSVRAVYAANKAANDAASAYNKLRAALYAEMKFAGVEEVHTAEGTVDLVAAITTPVSQAVNITKLRKALGDDEAVFAMASVTQTAAKAQVGDVILRQCLEQVEGKENVAVKATAKAKK